MMQPTQPILRALRGRNEPQADAALLDAIDLCDGADDGELRPLVEALVDRGQSAGQLGLVTRWHKLPEPIQQLLRRRVSDLAAGLRAAMQGASRQARANVLELIADGREPSLAYLASGALADSDRELADKAGESLRNFVQQFLACEPPAAPADSADTDARRAWQTWCENRDRLAQVARTGLSQFSNHQRLVMLEFAIRLSDHVSDHLRGILAEPHNRLADLLLEQALQSPRLGRQAAPFIHLALSVPQSRVRMARSVGLLQDRGMVEDIIRRAGLDFETVAPALAAIKRMAFFERPAWWEQMPDVLAASTVRWICASGIPPAAKAACLADLVRDGSIAQREAAIKALVRWDCPESSTQLREAISRTDRECAAMASGELIRRGVPADTPLAPVVTELSDDGHITQEQAAAMTFQRFWTQFDRLSTEVREFAAAKLRRMLPDLAQRLANKLSDLDPGQRLQAIRVIALCGFADRSADALYSCCTDPDAKVRSAAVKLMGQVSTARSKELVTRAINDTDRRVRANAVEAIESLGPADAATELMLMVDDPDNRIRANAIKAIMAMDVPTAQRNLERMLGDGSADHRLSALWVVEQINWFRPAQMVLQMAQADPDRRVRRRALQTLAELRRVYREMGHAKPTVPAPAGEVTP